MHSTRPGSLEQHLPLPPPTEDEHGAPEVWKCRLPSSGEVVAIGRTEVDARRLCTDMLVFTLAEVAVAIEALGEIALEAKRTFAGATVRAVRSRSSEKLKEGHKERAATPKRKPLPPAGSYQSLTKKMPPGTVYKGESYPVSNIKARYEEHMAQQHAAAAAQSSGERG